MIRALWSLLVLAGCDAVFGVAPGGAPDGPAGGDGSAGTHDEDGDGIVDDLDLCPVSAAPELDDTDGDGIGDACDPDPHAPYERAFLFTFETANSDGLAMTGSVRHDGDDLVLDGTASAGSFETAVYLLGETGPLTTASAHVDVGYTLIEPPPDDTWHELGIAFVGGQETLNGGDACVGGYRYAAPVESYVGIETGFMHVAEAVTPTSIAGERVTMRGTRSPLQVACVLDGPSIGVTTSAPSTLARDASGRVGAFAAQVQARLHYLWIVIPGTPPPAAR